MLVELLRDVGQTVTRDQLLDRVWTGRFPTPDVLTQAVKELCRALGDDSKPPQYIETIPTLGYRLIAPVLALDGPDSAVVVETAAPVVERPVVEERREIASANDARNPARALPRPFAHALSWLLAIAGSSIVLAAAAIVIGHLRSRCSGRAGAPTARRSSRCASMRRRRGS